MKRILTGSLIVLGLAVGMGLAACDKPNSAHALYKCKNNSTLDIVFTDGKQVQVGVGDKGYILDRVESASGAKYEKDDIIFWSKGIDANFIPKKGAPPLLCRRK